MEVKILGSGCSKCINLERKVRQLVEENHFSEIQVIKVSDLTEMLNYGIMMTPGLIIDGVVKSIGTVPADKKLVSWLKGE
ncbi:MAG TPA: thioredoxin family protein [Candidatus Marinimicrobia bacterium]|nr:MAG: thioredoxin family protein [Candidatus Marinimicrobia bacterium CG1_02_48_14]HCW76438.1 thioredoxin family protein [Candidatus Neomarinimicrobiota bacterium]